MGKIICEEHGEQGIEFVSPRLRAAMLACQQLNFANIRKIRFEIFEFECIAYFDEATVERLGVPLDHVLSEAELDQLVASNAAELIEPACSACFIEWQRSLGG